MDFVTFFQKNRRHIENNKFVLIIGSGFHQQAFKNEKNSLTSWPVLLKNLDPNLKLTGNHHIDFETLIYKEKINSKKNGSKNIENDLLNKVSEHINSISYENVKFNYPLDIFNEKYVSDIISLNFDLIPEKLISKVSSIKARSIKLKNNTGFLNTTLHYKVNNLRFWHPHGSVDKPNSILLGLRSYYLYATQVEKLRKYFMANRRLKVSSNDNWYSLLSERPIIICGASLSNVEFDLWLAIININRMGKSKMMPIFKMHEEVKNKSKASIIDNYFFPISSSNLSYDEQWSIIQNAFNERV